jgi:hypothetical protein
MLPFQSLLLHVFRIPQYGSPPSMSPSRSLYKKRCSPSKAFRDMSLRVPSKEPTLQVSLTEPLHGERCYISTILFYVSFKVLNKGAPSRFPSQIPIDGERRSISGIFFYLSLEVPGERAPPSESPNGAPMERDSHHQGFLLRVFKSVSKAAPRPNSPVRAPIEWDAPFREHSLTRLSKTKERTPAWFPHGAPWRIMPILRAFNCISLGDLVNKVS